MGCSSKQNPNISTKIKKCQHQQRYQTPLSPDLSTSKWHRGQLQQPGRQDPQANLPNAEPLHAAVLVGVDTEFGGDGKGCAVVQFATRSHMWVVDVRAAESEATLALSYTRHAQTGSMHLWAKQV